MSFLRQEAPGMSFYLTVPLRLCWLFLAVPVAVF